VSESGTATLAGWLAAQRRGAGLQVIGINGAQGSGKSTLAAELRELLAGRHGLNALVLSIDDLYLTRAQRERLALEVHPLLRTRGVPGTHDVELGMDLLDKLNKPAASAVCVPKFVKALDDRAPASEWTLVSAPADLVLFEGWCVGTPPQAEEALAEPVNALELDEDADGVWRRYANQQLATRYAPLFGRIDRMIFLKTPDFDSIFRWRLEQEEKNAAAAAGASSSRVMGPRQLRRFIQHYERLTRHALEVMPRLAEVVIELGTEHQWLDLRVR
jgi:D-glycerate 3-kinase